MNLQQYPTSVSDSLTVKKFPGQLHKIISSCHNLGNLSLIEYLDSDIDDYANYNNNLITNWLLTIVPDFYFIFVTRINNRINEIENNSYVKLFPENRDGMLALAIFLEFAESLHLQPLELYMLLDDPLNQSLEAVLSYQIMVMLCQIHIGK